MILDGIDCPRCHAQYDLLPEQVLSTDFITCRKCGYNIPTYRNSYSVSTRLKGTSEKIDSLKSELKSQYSILENLLRLYPPDGGGRGRDAQRKINMLLSEIKNLEEKKGAITSKTMLSGPAESKINIKLKHIHDEVNEDIIKGKIRLYDLPPRKFEEYIASILENHGFGVELTKQTRDGGYDIIVIEKNTLGIDIRIFVECKRYPPTKKVEISVVREMWGIMHDPINKFHQGIIATSSMLSPDAKEQLKRAYWKLTEWDHDEIMAKAGFKKTDGGIWVPYN